MRRSTDTLRRAVGLAHAVPGTELVLRSHSGNQLIAAAADTAEINICDLRRLLIASACPARPNLSDWIEAVDIQGSLSTCGGGIYRRACHGREERWFAVALRPEVVFGQLERLSLELARTTQADVVLKPDPCLGLTCVLVAIDGEHAERQLDELAISCLSACLVEELAVEASVGVDVSSPRQRDRPR